jgi:hypothetical protein
MGTGFQNPQMFLLRLNSCGFVVPNCFGTAMNARLNPTFDRTLAKPNERANPAIWLQYSPESSLP